MQRNIAYKNFIKYLIYSVVFALYIGLSTIYLYLPPFIAVLFLFFHKAFKNKETPLLFFIIIDILILEAQKGFLGFTLLIYFLLMDRFIIPKIEQSISAINLKNFLYVFFSYVGYILFSTLLGQIFLIPGVGFDFYIVYYIAIEFVIVSILR